MSGDITSVPRRHQPDSSVSLACCGLQHGTVFSSASSDQSVGPTDAVGPAGSIHWLG